MFLPISWRQTDLQTNVKIGNHRIRGVPVPTAFFALETFNVYWL